MIAYTAIYGAYDTPKESAVPVRLFTETTHPLRLSAFRAAKWWKLRPDLACPDADATVWIDGSLTITDPGFLEWCASQLGDADLALVGHPSRDCIYAEAEASLRGAKYAGMPIIEQVAAYRAHGYPEHAGLFHAGLLIRRNNEAVRAMDEAWWTEIRTWTVQDQLSLPVVLSRTGVKVALVTDYPFGSRLMFTPHLAPDVWQ